MPYFTPPPPAPDRRDPDTFSTKAKDSIDYWAIMTAEAEVFASDMNGLKDDAQTAKIEADAAKLAAEGFKDDSESARNVSLAAANFKGLWVNQAGAASIPYSVYHDGEYWMLVENLANVSASEPSDTNTNWRNISVMQIVRVPTAIAPLSGSTGVTPTPELDASGYANVYDSDLRDVRVFEVDVTAGDFSTPVYSYEGDVDSHTVASALDLLTGYKWRCRDKAVSGAMSSWSAVQSFITGSISINTPTLTVEGETLEVPETPTLETGAFDTTPTGEDTHLNTDWQILDDQLAVVWESLADAANKTSIQVPADTLTENTTYTFRVRHRGTTYGESAWASVVATTVEQFYIGPGMQGFGVGAYPGTLPTGFSALTGTDDPSHDNYGNYKYDADDSICCFVPKFYYRIAHEDNPTYGTYGVNSIDIKGAPATGYVLHRAFLDGGSELNGFFFDKYMASKNGSTAGKSVKNGVPISLTTNTSYTRSHGMTGCTGILADAVTLSRARGAGWQCASIFQWSAIKMLCLAHAQASTSTDHCAWYDGAGTTNFPKGCNNNALADVDDTGVTFTTAGDSGSANKPLTGSGSPFAKTTHNGQVNGIADVNGGLREVVIGATMPGTSDTDTAEATGTTSIWILKPSVEIASLTGGWNGATDVWQNASNISTLYDQVNIGLTHNTNKKWGNGTNQVLSGASSGAGYATDSLGFPRDNNAYGDSGTNLFGVDRWYMCYRANLAPRVCGDWDSSSFAGVWSMYVYSNRSSPNNSCGFRSAFGA